MLGFHFSQVFVAREFLLVAGSLTLVEALTFSYICCWYPLKKVDHANGKHEHYTSPFVAGLALFPISCKRIFLLRPIATLNLGGIYLPGSAKTYVEVSQHCISGIYTKNNMFNFLKFNSILI